MQFATTILAAGAGVPAGLGGRRRGALPSAPSPAGPRPRPARLCTEASKEGHKSNGGRSSAALDASPDQLHATKMLNLTLEYFEELMSKGNTDKCHDILDTHNFVHKDMVRNEGRYGISDYEHYIHELKKHYPNIWVRPTQFGVVDSHTLFVAFEGRATDRTPMFKGVDLFYFNDDATKIREIEVYRSNWLGAEGHEDRKRQAQQHQRGGSQPRMTT